MSRVLLNSITCRNFLSFGNIDQLLDLSFVGSTLILGENKDVGGHNGVGKTTLLEAISYALYGKTMAKIRKGKIKNNINTDKRASTEIRLELEIRNDVYEIVRCIGGGLDLAVYKNRDYENPVNPASIADTNKFIEELIGLSFELFKIAVIFLGSAESFFEMGQGSQRSILGELFKITTLDQKGDALKEVIKDTNKNIEIQEAVISQQQAQADKHNQQVLQAENRITSWQDSHNSDIATLDAKISSNKSKDVNVKEQEQLLDKVQELESSKLEAQTLINTEVAKLLEQQNEISDEYNPKIELLQDELTTVAQKYQPDIDSNKAEIIENDKSVIELKSIVKSLGNDNVHFDKSTKTSEEKIDEINKEIKHLEDNKCPYCKQLFNQQSDKISELETLLFDYSVLIENNLKSSANNLLVIQESQELLDGIIAGENDLTLNLETLINTLETESTELNTSIEALRLELYNKVQDKDKEIISFKDSANDDILFLTEVITSTKSECLFESAKSLLESQQELISQRDQLESKKKETNPHLDAYESLLSSDIVNVDHEVLDELKDDQEHQKFLLKLLTDKKSFIRKMIINKSIPFLNKQLRSYTKQLGLPHLVTFGADMQCEIVSLGKELDYGNLSGGEGKRVDFALSLAFRDILQHLHTGINILFVDEIDAGKVDPLGIEDMIRLLKFKAREEHMSLWVISHRPEMTNRFNRELLITKENGFSTLGEFT